MKLSSSLSGSTCHVLLVASVVLSACSKGSQARDARDTTGAAMAGTSPTQCGDDARRVVEQLGSRMRQVSLLAPTAAQDIAKTYSDLVTPSLLATWQQTPAKAPGRETSNPWPARVDVDSVSSVGDGCRIEGSVVLVLTSDTNTAVDRRRITASVRDSSGWRVSAWTTTATGQAPANGPSLSNDAAGASRIMRRYFTLITEHEYDSAYALWSDSGRASHQSSAEFAAGYRETAEVHPTIGDSVEVEGAAGSQYATVPVVIDAVLRDGTRQHFAGTYTLRRAMVDGATAEQRSWRIYSAAMQKR